MLKRLLSFISSLRLTVGLLVASLVLVFVGTLAQVQHGLWDAQKYFFRSMFVMWGPTGAEWKIPVWPGGWLLGWALLVNLIAAHSVRFKFTWKKSGIFLTHFGLIFLLLGQFVTELFQVESNMRIEEGQSKNYSESTRDTELALIDVTDPNLDEVVAIPHSKLAAKGQITHPKLPFTVRVKEWYENSDPRLVAPVAEPNQPRGTHGIGTRVTFVRQPVTKKMDEMNFASAQVEIVSNQGVESTWMVSTFFTLPRMAESVASWAEKNAGAEWGAAILQPQQFTFNGRTYQIALRQRRHYKFVGNGPQTYSIQLNNFQHDRYLGTDIAKNFASDIRLRNPVTGEDREIKIYMNNPLRYAGETYYQGSFEPGDTVTILQVVRNPAWLTPYVACSIVALGLIVQFMIHLVGFSRRRASPAAPKAGAKTSAPAVSGSKSNARKPTAPDGGGVGAASPTLAVPRVAGRKNA